VGFARTDHRRYADYRFARKAAEPRYAERVGGWLGGLTAAAVIASPAKRPSV